ncbi:MAG: hypothetical protein KDC38_03905 [Planctomycetes bacterium]|nr:hypothetical protein [Planctomycetota bacterium]
MSRLLRRVAWFTCGLAVAASLTGAFTCLAAGAPHLAVAALLVAVAWASAIATAFHHRRRMLSVGAVALIALGWLIAPAEFDRSSPTLLRTRSLAGDGTVAPPWLGRIPEREWVRLGGALALRGSEASPELAAQLAHLVSHENPGVLPPGESRAVESWVWDRRHVWIGVIPDDPGAPLVIILHGNGGNFRAYAQLLAPPLLAHGFAIAFPTNGYGCWSEADLERVRAVRDAVESETGARPRSVILGGVSAGGIGALRIATIAPEDFDGCFAISGVEGGGAVPPIPTLLIHGTRDGRIGVEVARRLVEDRLGVTLREIDADHFALLTQTEIVLRFLIEWLDATGIDARSGR